MDVSAGGSGGFGNKKEDNNQNSKGKSISYDFTSDQEAKLEEFFERCPRPDETQLDELAKDLGLEPDQIKIWLQKKTRTEVSTPESQAPTPKPEEEHPLEETWVTCVLNQECDIFELDQYDSDSSHETLNNK